MSKIYEFIHSEDHTIGTIGSLIKIVYLLIKFSGTASFKSIFNKNLVNLLLPLNSSSKLRIAKDEKLFGNIKFLKDDELMNCKTFVIIMDQNGVPKQRYDDTSDQDAPVQNSAFL
ncbi:hypothetical protein C1645_881905 [Glomus cerebriforme]|uniref:Uncharacterized protein n=1 Tax=Glomus cerebriforme TaxID=658196 RepID=A0A397SDS8_9GLOM|nr:hypothetical protein C1645_881905 [Glomus cerebriforme]